MNLRLKLHHWAGAAGCFLAFAGNAAQTASRVPPPDRRVAKLESFFKAYACPEPYHIADYLNAADRHDIDYRLLPAVSVRESLCGVGGRLNNFWGWDNARSGFASVKEGIDYIAWRLAQSPHYRNRTLEQKLYHYNPVPGYVKSVKGLMREIERE